LSNISADVSTPPNESDSEAHKATREKKNKQRQALGNCTAYHRKEEMEQYQADSQEAKRQRLAADTTIADLSWSTQKPTSQSVFGLGNKRSMVTVKVITVGSKPMAMAPQHRHIGQCSDYNCDNHRHLHVRYVYVKVNSIIVWASEPPV
jgi:hypothetical protein